MYELDKIKVIQFANLLPVLQWMIVLLQTSYVEILTQNVTIRRCLVPLKKRPQRTPSQPSAMHGYDKKIAVYEPGMGL